jgi:hypothetical protein
MQNEVVNLILYDTVDWTTAYLQTSFWGFYKISGGVLAARGKSPVKSVPKWYVPQNSFFQFLEEI